MTGLQAAELGIACRSLLYIARSTLCYYGVFERKSERVCVCRYAEEGSTYMGGGSKGEWELVNEEILQFKECFSKSKKKKKGNMTT